MPKQWELVPVRPGGVSYSYIVDLAVRAFDCSSADGPPPGLVITLAPDLAPHLVLLMGGMLMVYGASPLVRAVRTARWPRVQGRLLSFREASVDTVQSQYGTRPYLYPEVEFEYQIGGKRYLGTRVGHAKADIVVPAFDDRGMELPDSAKFWSGWEAGSDVDVFVDPLDHEHGLLKADLTKRRRSHYLALIAGGGILLLCWVALLLA